MKRYQFYESKNIHIIIINIIFLNKFRIQITQRQLNIFTGTVKSPDQ